MSKECPYCGSPDLINRGPIRLRGKRAQAYLCADCHGQSAEVDTEPVELDVLLAEYRAGMNLPHHFGPIPPDAVDALLEFAVTLMVTERELRGTEDRDAELADATVGALRLLSRKVI